MYGIDPLAVRGGRRFAMRSFAGVLVLAALVATGLCWTSRAVAATTPTAGAHTVTYDGYSFKVDGRRTYLWSGEFHYFRLPSPDLWRDIFQKMRAAGFNTTSLYFDWGYHSPRPGVYDFSGVRDVDKVLDLAQEAGLYVIARPAPYINAEVDSGGLPGWLTTKAENNRSDDPRFLSSTPTSGSPGSTASWPATSSPTAPAPSSPTRSRTSTTTARPPAALT